MGHVEGLNNLTAPISFPSGSFRLLLKTPIEIDMSSEDLWRFFDSRDESRMVTVKGIESAKVLSKLIPAAELMMWMVEHPSLLGMQSVADCALIGNATQEITVISLKKEDLPLRSTGSGRERRQHKRVNARLKVIILAGDDMFSCCSTNVSIGGLLLENPIPSQFHNRDCKVLISSSDNSLQAQFKIKILEASVRGSRLMFDSEMDPENKEKLQMWIDANDHDIAA